MPARAGANMIRGDTMPLFRVKGKNLYINGLKVIKAYESFNGWYWFVIDFVQRQDTVINGKIHKDDVIVYGLVQGTCEEWGDFSLAEVESMKPRVWEIPKKDLIYAGRR